MANRYWVGGAGTWNDSSTANWSASSGGASGASAPTQSDDVFFDQATTYTVTCNNGSCRNITVNTGTVTFNVTSSGGCYFFCYGNISIIAATLFTAPTNAFGSILHTPLAAAGCTVSFGNSGTNTQKMQFFASQNYGAWGATSYTFCTAATATFASVVILGTSIPFTCAGSTITVDNPDRNGGTTDSFYISGFNSVSVAATTINMGTVTATTLPQAADFGFLISGATVEPAITTFNVIQIRAYSGTGWASSWGSSALPLKFGNITLKGNQSSSPIATIDKIYGANAFTATDYSTINITGGTATNKVFSGAFALNGVQNCVFDITSTTVTFSTTVTLATGAGGTYGSTLNLSGNSGNITFTGAVSSTGTASSASSISISNGSNTTLFSSTYTSTYGSFAVESNALTFTGAISITDPPSFSARTYAGNLTISNALSITGTTLRDGLSQTLTFIGNLSTSSTATNWTFTNARPVFTSSLSMTVSNPVSLVNSGGLYFSTADLTLTSALSSSGASQWNVLAAIDSGRTLTLNNAVTLVNCQLAATTITVAGGASKNFAYSLSTPIANNTPYTTTTVPYGSPIAQNYPEICADTFTLSTTGGTFSIAGGGSAIYRTFIRPYTISGSPVCTLTLPALTPTLTDVDFWRVTVAGAVTKPLTGTRLGNVGTITNITTATPKSVYWVGGAGAWSDAKWATATGGSGSVLNYPLPQDNVYFDANSGTGAMTYPASVRIKSFIVDAVPAGTTSVYCNSTNATTSPSYLWVSGDINGPAATPTGTFVLGNTSTSTYNSFTTGYINQDLIIADGSSGATHTINPTNMQFMRYGSMQFATLGTTTISTSITEPIFIISDFCLDAYTINITASQIGSSSFDYGNVPPASVSIGSSSYSSIGTVNYGSCNIYTYSFYPSTLTSNTAYSVYAGDVYAVGSTNLGNINFIQGTVGSTIYTLTVNQAVTLLGLSILSKSNFTGTTLRVTHNGSAPRNISMYSLTATYSGSLTTMAISQQFGSKPTFVKLGGGSVGLSGVNVTNIDASPASTWFTTGTVTTSTGWNAGAGPNSKGGFLLFQ